MPDRPPIQRAAWRLDVSDAVPLDGRFEIAADLIAPQAEQADSARPVLCCLPGGFLSRRYFDLEVGGDRRYSFAEAMARAGFTTLAFDHLGVGESSRPNRLEDGYALDTEAIARINQTALDRALERLRAGVDEASLHLPARSTVRTIGVGHSMGSMLTVEQQALARPHLALVLFSFSTRGTPAFLDEATAAYANDSERSRKEIGSLAARAMGSPYPDRATDSEAGRRAAFGVGTAPPSAEEALHGAATNLLAVGGLLSMIPGGYAPPAKRIDVPVLMLAGDHDMHDDRHTHDELSRSPRVDTRIIDDCWHCHFVANTRETIWRDVTDWIDEILADGRPLPEETP